MAAPDLPYIDHSTFLSPTFSASTYANTLVLSTNNSSDTPLDLTTPLSRALFDLQEINTSINDLSTRSALPILTHTQTQTVASAHISQELEAQVKGLTDVYARLEKEVVKRYEEADEVRAVSERLWLTVRLGRAVGRALTLGRQLELQIGEVNGSTSTGSISTSTSATATPKAADHRALIRSSNTLFELRVLLSANSRGQEGEGLQKVHIISTLQRDLVLPAERSVRARAQQLVREFSLSSLASSNGGTAAATFARTEDVKARTTSALLALYLLSTPPGLASAGDVVGKGAAAGWLPDGMLGPLREYLHTALTSSMAALTRSLGTLPTLDRTLLEVATRCQNVVALEALLASITPPEFPSSSTSTMMATAPSNLLTPLLATLETSSLASYFWRTLASGLSTRVQELMSKGGVSARTLKSNREGVREAVRECVLRGCRNPGGSGRGVVEKEGAGGKGWEREVAVMVGAVVGGLGR